ncbi:MAG: hypothetical protein FJ026_09285 [Chloroflexi bacterium]|nr:hypothetical protein [Chloroflexota bacterium]
MRCGAGPGVAWARFLRTCVGFPSGQYKIQEVNPAGYLSTTPDVIMVTLTGNEGAIEANFADALPVAIYGAVFYDADGDGQFLFPESGLSGVKVALYSDADGDGALDADKPVLARATTDDQGNYLLMNLLPGKVIVVETDPPGYVSTTPNVVPLILISNEASGGISVDFGDTPSARRHPART